MSLFVLADLHLSLGEDKPMDIFSGWEDYEKRIENNWKALVTDEDTVVLPGDISWAMSLDGAAVDMGFVHALPGKKIISKGNHDYWWTTMAKMERFLEANGYGSISFLHNNHYRFGEYGICGTRGWIAENGEPADAKVLARETMRLEASLLSAEKEGLTPIAFLHYPPVFGNTVNESIMDVLIRHGIKKCFYGHLHGRSCNFAVNGVYEGIEMQLVSCDYVRFTPVKIM